MNRAARFSALAPPRAVAQGAVADALRPAAARAVAARGLAGLGRPARAARARRCGAGVFRHPQHGGADRHLADAQIPDRGAGRRARRRPPRHPQCRRTGVRPRRLLPLVRRGRLRHRRRHAVPPVGRLLPALLPGADARLADRHRLGLRRTDPGRDRAPRGAGAAGADLVRRARGGRVRRRGAAPLRHGRGRAGSADLAHRLHRRPRLRALDGWRGRARPLGPAVGGRARTRPARGRHGGARHRPHRGGLPADAAPSSSRSTPPSGRPAGARPTNWASAGSCTSKNRISTAAGRCCASAGSRRAGAS